MNYFIASVSRWCSQYLPAILFKVCLTMLHVPDSRKGMANFDQHFLIFSSSESNQLLHHTDIAHRNNIMQNRAISARKYYFTSPIIIHRFIRTLTLNNAFFSPFLLVIFFLRSIMESFKIIDQFIVARVHHSLWNNLHWEIAVHQLCSLDPVKSKY